MTSHTNTNKLTPVRTCTPENIFASGTFRGENVAKIQPKTVLKETLALLGGFAAAGVMLLAFLAWITVVLG